MKHTQRPHKLSKFDDVVSFDVKQLKHAIDE